MELKEIIERLEEQAELLRSPQEKALMEAARILMENQNNAWIDAEKDPPSQHSPCIIICEGSLIAEDCYAMLSGGSWVWFGSMGVSGTVPRKVTHWMPRPKAPK